MAQISQEEFNRFAINVYSRLDSFAEKQDLAIKSGLQSEQRHEENDYIIKSMIESQVKLQTANEKNQPKIDSSYKMQDRVSAISWTLVLGFVSTLGYNTYNYLFKKSPVPAPVAVKIKNENPEIR